MGNIRKIFQFLLKVSLRTIVVFFSLIIFTFIWLCVGHYQAQFEIMKMEKFDKEEWANTYNRIYMYDDLRKNYLKNNISIIDVVSLLGEAEAKRYYSSPKGTMECLQYNIGGYEWFFYSHFDLVICPNLSGMIIGEIKLIRNNSDDGGKVKYKSQEK